MTTTPATQPLLPVTPETFSHHRDLIDDEALARLRDGVRNNGGHVTVLGVNFNTMRRLIARLDGAEACQSHSIPGDVGMLVEAAAAALKCLEISVQSFPDVERKLRAALTPSALSAAIGEDIGGGRG